MMRAVVCLALLVACSGKKKPPAVDAAQLYPAGDQPDDHFDVRCEKVLPAALLDEFFPGAQLQGGPAAKTGSRACAIVAPGNPVRTVTVACREAFRDEATFALFATDAKGQDVTDIGRKAVLGDLGVVFWDGDTPCFVSIHWPGGGDKVPALARKLDAALTRAIVE